MTAAAKRYRCTGMERDDETGLEYHNARYYISWLGRWMNCDPIGIGDGVNVHAYCRNNPVGNVDVSGMQTRKGEATSRTGATTNQPLMSTSTTNNSVNVAGLGLAKQIAVADSTAKAHEQQAEEKAKNLRKLGTLSETPREYTIFKKHENDLKSDNPFISNAAQRRMYHELHGPNVAVDIYSFFGQVGNLYVPPVAGLRGTKAPKLGTFISKESVKTEGKSSGGNGSTSTAKKGLDGATSVYTIYSNKYKIDYKSHMTDVQSFSGKAAVKGGHNQTNFFSYLKNNNKQINILSTTPHPTQAGIYEIIYNIQKGDGTGGWKAEKFRKTLYDPAIISDETMIEYGEQAIAQGIKAGTIVPQPNSDSMVYGEYNGIKFVGYMDPVSNVISNFHPTIK